MYNNYIFEKLHDSTSNFKDAYKKYLKSILNSFLENVVVNSNKINVSITLSIFLQQDESIIIIVQDFQLDSLFFDKIVSSIISNISKPSSTARHNQ